MEFLRYTIFIFFCCISLSVSKRNCPKSCRCTRTRIDCSDRNMSSIPSALLNYTRPQQIEELDLSHNRIEVIKAGIFKKFTHLVKLKVNNNPLKRIDEDAFTKFYLIRELDLSHTGISQLPKFKNLMFLRTLYLSGNNLRVLRANDFAGCVNLQVLYLDFNKFEDVPAEGLKVLKYLGALSLEHNQIKRVGEKSFFKLKNLITLKLNANKIRKVTKGAFLGLTSLRKLNLQENELTFVPREALKSLKSLVELDLNDNLFSRIPANAFSGLTSLSEINIFENDIQDIAPTAFREMPALTKLVVSNVRMTKFPDLTGSNGIETLELTDCGLTEIPPTFCDGKVFLHDLSLQNNKIRHLPKMAGCEHLENLKLDGNRIREIRSDALSGLHYLEKLSLWHNPLKRIANDAFKNLSSLEEIEISNVFMGEFPNLEGTNSLKTLKLRGCGLSSIPKTFCRNRTSLRTLQLDRNDIRVLPDMSGCKGLRMLEINENKIESIDGKLAGLNDLLDLYLDHNQIRSIGMNALASTKGLERLSMNNNLLEHINPMAFSKFESIQKMYLRNNRLTELPTEGLRSLFVIETKGNPDLKYFPTHDKLPNVRKLVLDYPYHCCYYLKKMEELNDAHKKVAEKVVSVSWRWDDGSAEEVSSGAIFNSHPETLDDEDIEPLLRKLNNGTKIIFGNEEKVFPIIREKEQHLLHSLVCSPPPDAFYPCEELMGKQWLRICVWFVLLLALVGNCTVLFVLCANCLKMDVQRLLIINLALADLCLAIYLGFLAVVDITTLGDFRAHAIDWQFSSNCKAAGFLAVFASELSVYTLTVITIERFLTIKYSMYIEKQVTVFKAAIIMIFGWLFSLTVAVLPLLRFPTSAGDIYFSDYTKYSVCLPFDVPDSSSPAYLYSVVYLSFLLIFNLLAFIIIVYCYVRIYWTIRGSNAFNSGDSRIARRMALLIFTDFACWFPIAVVALSAVFNEPLVEDLWLSKVFTVFVFPLNACANPFLYAIFTKQFQNDFFAMYRHMKGGDASMGDKIRRALKASQVNYSSFRRRSSCSVVFGRRGSRPDDVRINSRTFRTPLNTDDERNNKDETSALPPERETCL